MAKKEIKTTNQAPSPSAAVADSARRVNKKPLYIIGGLVLSVLCGWFIMNNGLPWNKALAEVDGHKIYQSDVDQLRGDDKSISDREAATVLADEYLTQAMGKEQNVSVNDDDIAQEFGVETPQHKNKDNFAYQNMKNQTYFAKLSRQYRGEYSGKLLVAHFSRYVPYNSPLLAEKKAGQPKLGDPSAIAADKQYARDFITNLYNRVKSGEITFDEAIKAERADPVVGERGYATLSHSQDFSGPLNDYSLLSAKSIRKQIEALRPGDLSKPFVVRSSSSMYDDSTSESYWLVIQLDKKTPGGTGTFEEQLTRTKKELGYKINV